MMDQSLNVKTLREALNSLGLQVTFVNAVNATLPPALLHHRVIVPTTGSLLGHGEDLLGLQDPPQPYPNCTTTISPVTA
ncbi:hypothetical protein GFS31_05940 [Leptolyngbya sp. BL0902]|uniref:hypothetical protein n=1 Tax=Leptolyngbya sp. BL0902 TaxID=1115757 RepID=UPI0018E85731|nr:hypothetical protein [Leptolyngbya sp. BL0902]QQE63923.1 hypothetical protein GFS31_05940 [Leptolyngbya sp. BL0902]